MRLASFSVGAPGCVTPAGLAGVRFVPAAVVVAADREDRVTDRDQHLAGDVGAVETERAETGEDLLALDVVVLGWGCVVQ